ncbi:FAD-binding oxidoreductase [Bradyrhizobium diazoefficiens]|nr:FAD-dependent oxidoreductase [Bradyrhizobium diazoefficiens]QQN61711.1 FAD-binding oxidoreductase [Bradyrhizobium diazoefficiens]
MDRRHFLASALSLAAGSVLGKAQAGIGPTSRTRPGQPGWPSDADWSGLNQATSGRLSRLASPKLDAADAKQLLANPFYIGDQPGLTQSSGWFEAWRSEPSTYMVAAESSADVAAAVRFAKAHNLRLVVKGRGHSYFGASCAPDSLLLWTRKMDAITVHDRFIPADSNSEPVPAITAGAGCMWLHAYQAAAGAGRYVQGGGCTTVGVAGLVQGGGFGNFSKAFGTAAASLLEAEIVTADGEIRVVNETREPELFWALRGGGGGTFGVTTRLTLATHPLPSSVGAVNATLRARSDGAYRKLLARFVEFCATSLCNPHWGEQVRVHPDNRLELRMVFQDLTTEEARAAFKPLLDFVAANADDYAGTESLEVVGVPARYFWNGWLYRLFARSAVNFDGRSGAPWTDYWWKGDGEQVGAFWHAYTSAWLPSSLLGPESRTVLVDALFNASRHWAVGLHLNKGLFGAPPEVIAKAQNTATHPDAFDAFALAIIAASGPTTFGGLATPDPVLAKAHRDRVNAAMAALRIAAPNSGAYVNECDYFQSEWQNALWGPNYQRLLAVKRRYDPDGLFFVHHGVGTEGWSADGFTRLPSSL